MLQRYVVYGVLLEVALVICWSSGFIGAKLASNTPSVFLVLFWRFLLTAGCLLPFVVTALREGVTARQIGLQAIIGALAMFGYLALGVTAIDLGVPLGTGALIAALQPLTTAAMAGPLLGETVRPVQWIGLGLGLLGVFAAVSGSLGTAPLWAYALSFLSMLCIVAATITSKRVETSLPILPALGIQSAVTALLFAPLAALDGSLMPPADRDFIVAVAWFIVFSTIGGYGFYWLCLRRSTATRVASLIYLTPPVVSIWAWLMFSEPITPLILVGFLLCMAGVWLAARSRNQKAP